MDNNEVKTRGGDIELGTFEFLKTGWWVLHVVAIIAVFYLGYWLGDKVFR